jgi:hypothetical protein
MAKFFSVQSAEDAVRLAKGGSPWPTGLQRANLGTGFYAWESLETAEQYRNLLQQHGATDLRIVVYEVADESLGKLRKLDLTQLSDDEVNAWMEKHSHYGDAEPHDWEYVLRNTDLGTEHYFAAAIFGQLTEVP